MGRKMAHRIVENLWFTREKWLSGYADISAEDAVKRIGDANSVSWMVGHLACFEQFTWCQLAQGITVVEELRVYDFGQPATTPALNEVLEMWHKVMPVADQYLETLTTADMSTHLVLPNGAKFRDDIGTTILRHTWHYWYHLGEMRALRSGMQHKNMPQFVGNMAGYGQYSR
ncbi:MAG: DinB family protein [Ardenticatenaceae bacterium]|nr:DinB family protein [Ardenticatenaceae bacterium]